MPLTLTPAVPGSLVFSQTLYATAIVLGDGNPALQVGTALNLDTQLLSRSINVSKVFSTQGALAPGYTSAINVEATAKGSSRAAGPTDRFHGYQVTLVDAADVVNKTVSGAANNGSGKIRLTVTGHGFATNDSIYVYGVTGTTEANGVWNITAISADTFDLQGSTFSNAYVSGGTATNRSAYIGVMIAVVPNLDRLVGGTDDVVGVAVINSGSKKATDAFYLGRNTLIAGTEWATGVTLGANCDIGIQLLGAYTWGLDLYGSSGTATYSTGPIRLPNAKSVYGRNNADSSDVALFQIDEFDSLRVWPTLRLMEGLAPNDGVNFTFGSTTGNKIGTATTQKLAFYNSAPVTQPNTTGTATGFTAGAGTAVNDDSTFTGAVGATAYRISDVVKHLKNLGLIAQ